MKEWKKVKLGEICEITSSKRIFYSEYVEKGVPFYRSKEIIELSQGQSISEPLYISENRYNEIKDKFGVPQANDILLTSVGSIGIPYIVNSKDRFYFKDGNLTWLHNYDQSVAPLYILYWIKSDEGFNLLNNIALGAAQKALTIAKLKEVEISLPPLPTQHRIASILSRYDALIENYQKQIKLLEEAAARLYKQWFVELKFPGYQNTTIIDGVPEGWEKKTLSEIFTFVRGKSYTSKELSDDGIIMVNLKNIQAFGGYKRDAEKRFTGKYKDEQSLNKGDLIMGVTDMTQERRLVGHVALVPNFNEPATFSMDLIKIIPFEIPKNFIYCSMRYGGLSTKISPLANGVNVLHLKPEAIMGIEMTIPPKRLIGEFNLFIDKTMDSILNLQSQIRHLTESRDRLLPKLMSGELEV